MTTIIGLIAIGALAWFIIGFTVEIERKLKGIGNPIMMQVAVCGMAVSATIAIVCLG